MKNNFLCPKCKGHLNVADHIILSAKREKGERGLLLLHPELGNYQVVHHPSFSYDEGEKLDFCCPLCHARLTSHKHDNLANVLMVDHKDHKKYEIIFSKLAGERATYKVLADFVETFGEDSANYMKLFYISSIK